MSDHNPIYSHEQLMLAIANESRKFQECYVWLEKAMPRRFFEETEQESVMLAAHGLMGFPLQGYYSMINLPNAAIILCLDSPDADLRILKNYAMYGIKNYRTFVSKIPPPFPGVTANLRVATLFFTELVETAEEEYSPESREELLALVKKRNPDVSNEEFEKLLKGINTRFLKALGTERMALALDMFFRAKTRDHCQYEVRYNEDWEEHDIPSMQIMLAWRNTPKHNFLYRLASMVQRHGLIMKRVNASYIDPHSRQPILIMGLGLHGANQEAVWDVADIPYFLRELVTLKYFDISKKIGPQFVDTHLLSGNLGSLLVAMKDFIHQALVHVDPNLYTLENIEEALLRHPELTVQLCDLFELKFDPDNADLNRFDFVKKELKEQIQKLDTGREANDNRRKNVLLQGINFIEHTLKTNFYRNNKTALSFRVDPKYLDELPFDRKHKFPELPYGIFYVRGLNFFGFQIRFKDLARGGVRTVVPQHVEHMVAEQNNVFTECYNLAYTQQKKNKDIPEGGSKGVIFIRLSESTKSEIEIFKKEYEAANIDPEKIEEKITEFQKEQKLETLYQAQRSFIEALITIVNTKENGQISAKHIIDYWQRPEYIYLGPDENMHVPMIQWIAGFSKKYKYKPGGSFISSKPGYGINHKEYGVTSLGVNVYMHEVLKFMGIDPKKDRFTVKISGGPDGDVAGNQLLNLYRDCPDTAKLIALTDGSGTINDPEGLDLACIKQLFDDEKPIKYYPAEKLSEGGFLMDRLSIKQETAFSQKTLCLRKKDGAVVEDWLSGSESNSLFRNNLHQAKTDVFIPAGGRPRTLHEGNIDSFLDENGEPTSKAIVEGANLYLTPGARRVLEEKGVIIIKDSSANKAGVICSSFEVLCGLALGDELFLTHKEQLVNEILDKLKECALDEARLMLRTFKEKKGYLTDISDTISARINQFTYQLLDHLDEREILNDASSPLMKAFLNYCLPSLREKFQDKLLKEIPDHHKKAIISCYLASHLVYEKGVDWFPSVVDILPIILKESSYCQ